MLKRKQYKKIAVSILGPLGDVINTSALFKNLRKNYPDAQIDVITIDRGLTATYGIPEINNRYVFARKQKGWKSLINMFEFAKDKKNYDLYICLDNSFRSAILAFIIGAKERIGRKGQCREFLFTKTIPFLPEEKEGNVPVCEYYYRLLKPLGIYDKENKPLFYYSEEDDNIAKDLLKENCSPNKKILGLCVFAWLEGKSVEVDNAVEIVKKLHEETDYQIVLIGGPDVVERVELLQKQLDFPIISFAGKTNFAQSAAIIDKCSKFLSVDTGPAHLAMARKTPLVSIFFSKIYKKWGPADLNYNSLIVNLENKYISPDEVLQKIKTISDKCF